MSLIELVKTYREIHNHHHIDAVMEMLTDDISFETIGVWVKEGKEEIRSLEEYDTVVNGAFLLNDFSSSKNEVTVTAVETNDWLQIAGIDEVSYKNVKFTFRGQQIRKIKAEFTPESMKSIAEILNSVTEWAKREQPELLERLMPGGEFKYGTEGGRNWMVLMRKWKDA